jgi:hypothetical protein
MVYQSRGLVALHYQNYVTTLFTVAGKGHCRNNFFQIKLINEEKYKLVHTINRSLDREKA